jgi:uncharacterized protein YndB with AHSA1/START domain
MTQISPYHVRRSVFIDAPPDAVWSHFESLEAMRAWYGIGHKLAAYEARLGGHVVTLVDIEGTEHRFSGDVVHFDPGHAITFEQFWEGSNWLGPASVTIRLTALDDGTLVELFHHGYERLGQSVGDMLDGFESGWTNRHVHALRELVNA